MGKVENEVGTNNDIEMGKKPDFAFKLKFDVSQVEKYASEYSYERSESEVIKNSLKIRDRGYLTKSELQIIGNWKTPRSKPKIAANSEHYVKEVTSIAFSTKNENLHYACWLAIFRRYESFNVCSPTGLCRFRCNLLGNT